MESLFRKTPISRLRALANGNSVEPGVPADTPEPVGKLSPRLTRRAGLFKVFQRFPPIKELGLAVALLLMAHDVTPISQPDPSSAPPVPSKLAVMFWAALYRAGLTIAQRAAVDFSDDFRLGLGAWQTKTGLAPTWTYDQAGFVQPGALGLYRPTMELSDYNLDFITQVSARPLGVAYRVQDWNDYYALKLKIDNAGPYPRIDLVRYTVVDGREIGRVVRSVAAPLRNISLYHLKLNVNNSNFTLFAEGQIVDYWSESRYAKGGLGFFGGKGERARVISVEVSHQRDWLGRFCALLASYQNGAAAATGESNE